MPTQKTKRRVLDNVGEIWLDENGTYSFRMFEFDVTGEGYDSLYRAETNLETKWMTECKRRCGQLDGYEMHADPREYKYHKDAYELLRRKW